MTFSHPYHLIFIRQNLIIKSHILSIFLNLNYRTVSHICINSFETKVLYISRVVIKQLLKYKLQDYFQINNFLIGGCRLIL